MRSHISNNKIRRKASGTPFFTKVQRSQHGSSDAPFFQTKLTIGQPGDRYEQEADAMAERVVGGGNTVDAPAVQSKCAACGQDEGAVLPKLQRMGEEEEEMQMKPMIQRMGPEEEEMQMKSIMRSGSGTVQASADLESQLSGSKGGGRELPQNTQEEMGQSFGADFSNVRVHTGSEASQMSQGIQAQAFTHGSDVYFNEGKYNPDSGEGKKLLAHELTHTIQQGAVG